MLRTAMLFLVLALVAGVFGFLGIVAAAVAVGKLLFWLFMVLFVVALVAGVVAGRKVTS